MSRSCLGCFFWYSSCCPGTYFLGSYRRKIIKADFEITASYIEACSCDMFFRAMFNTHSTKSHGHGRAHMDEHFCRGNLVLKVDKGHYKEAKMGRRKGLAGPRPGSDCRHRQDSLLVMNFASIGAAADIVSSQLLTRSIHYQPGILAGAPVVPSLGPARLCPSSLASL